MYRPRFPYASAGAAAQSPGVGGPSTVAAAAPPTGQPSRPGLFPGEAPVTDQPPDQGNVPGRGGAVRPGTDVSQTSFNVPSWLPPTWKPTPDSELGQVEGAMPLFPERHLWTQRANGTIGVDPMAPKGSGWHWEEWLNPNQPIFTITGRTYSNVPTTELTRPGGYPSLEFTVGPPEGWTREVADSQLPSIRPPDGDIQLAYILSRPLTAQEHLSVTLPDNVNKDGRGFYIRNQRRNVNITGELFADLTVSVTLFSDPTNVPTAAQKRERVFATQCADVFGTKIFQFKYNGSTGDHPTADTPVSTSDIVICAQDGTNVSENTVVNRVKNVKMIPGSNTSANWTFGIKLKGNVAAVWDMLAFKESLAGKAVVEQLWKVEGGVRTELTQSTSPPMTPQSTLIWVTISFSVAIPSYIRGLIRFHNASGGGASPDFYVEVNVGRDGDDVPATDLVWTVDGATTPTVLEFPPCVSGQGNITKEFQINNSSAGSFDVLFSECALISKKPGDHVFFSIENWGIDGGARPTTNGRITNRGFFKVKINFYPIVTSGAIEAQLRIAFRPAGTIVMRTQTLDIVTDVQPAGSNLNQSNGDNLQTGIYDPNGAASGVAGGNPMLATNTPMLELLFTFRHTTDPDVQMAAYTTAFALWLANKPLATSMMELSGFNKDYQAAAASIDVNPLASLMGISVPRTLNEYLTLFNNDITRAALQPITNVALRPEDMKWIQLIITLGFQAASMSAPHGTAATPGAFALGEGVKAATGLDIPGTVESAFWGLNLAGLAISSLLPTDVSAVGNDIVSAMQALNTIALAKVKLYTSTAYWTNSPVRRQLMVPRGFMTAQERDEQIAAVQNGMQVQQGVPSLGSGLSVQQNFPRGPGVYTDIVPTVVKPQQLGGITYWTPPAGGNAPGTNAASGQGVLGGGLSGLPAGYNLIDPIALYKLAGLSPMERMLYLNGRLASLPHKPGDIDAVIASLKQQQGSLLNHGPLARMPPFWVKPSAVTMPMTQYKQYVERQEQALAAQVDAQVAVARLEATDRQETALRHQMKRVQEAEMTKFFDVPRKRRFLDVQQVAPFHNLNPLDIADSVSQRLLAGGLVPRQMPDA